MTGVSDEGSDEMIIDSPNARQVVHNHYHQPSQPEATAPKPSTFGKLARAAVTGLAVGALPAAAIPLAAYLLKPDKPATPTNTERVIENNTDVEVGQPIID